jgi:hypothetical protein
LFFAFVGPWIAMAIAGLLTNHKDQALLMAGPSPTFAVTMVRAVSSWTADSELILATGCACAAAWALIGVGLFAAASVRIRGRLEAADRAQATLQRAFAAEDLALLGPAPDQAP